MREVLQNLALIHLNDFCKRHGIDCSGSHLKKEGRGFTWCLVDEKTKEPFVFVIFHKSSSPAYMIVGENERVKNYDN